MTTSRRAVFTRALLNHYAGGAIQERVAILSEEEPRVIMDQDVSDVPLEAFLGTSFENLNLIHYTHLQEALKKLPESLRPLALSALPKQQREKLGCVGSPPSKPIQTWVLGQLFEALGTTGIVPAEAVQSSLVSHYALLPREQLLDAIDLLGIYDIVDEFQQILDKRQLEKIYTALKEPQRHFLKSIRSQTRRWQSIPLGIETWGGDEKKLLHAVHRRGLVRLGMSLQGHPNICWHVTHRVDTGRAKIIEEAQMQEFSEDVINEVAEQASIVIKGILL